MHLRPDVRPLAPQISGASVCFTSPYSLFCLSHPRPLLPPLALLALLPLNSATLRQSIRERNLPSAPLRACPLPRSSRRSTSRQRLRQKRKKWCSRDSPRRNFRSTAKRRPRMGGWARSRAGRGARWPSLGSTGGRSPKSGTRLFVALQMVRRCLENRTAFATLIDVLRTASEISRDSGFGGSRRECKAATVITTATAVLSRNQAIVDGRSRRPKGYVECECV